jgi:hypothetical protein
MRKTNQNSNMNKIKKPAWVLFEQLHIDVHVSTRMKLENRNKLRKALTSPSLQKQIINMVLVSGPKPPEGINPQVRVKVTR